MTNRSAILKWLKSRNGRLKTTQIDGCIDYLIIIDQGIDFGRAYSERDLWKKIGDQVLKASGHEDLESLGKEVEMWEESLGKGGSGNG